MVGGASREETLPYRVLIADDHELLRTGISAMLASDPDLEVVGEAQDGETAVELCRRLRPDLVLMDLSMPGMDGILATRIIKAEFPRVGVLVLTAHADQRMLLDAIRAGPPVTCSRGSGPPSSSALCVEPSKGSPPWIRN
jgi:DNA-binding NarL/FixJ family response regulator